MTDIAKKRVQFGENTLFSWSEARSNNDDHKTYKKRSSAVSTPDNKRIHDGHTGCRGSEGTKISSVRSVPTGKVIRSLSSQPVKNTGTSLPSKCPASARPITRHLHTTSNAPARNSHPPKYAPQAGRPQSARHITRAASARPTSRPRSARLASDRDHPARPINRILPERQVSRALSERPTSGAVPERLIRRALPKQPTNGALPERPVSRAPPEQPVIGTAPEQPINQTLTRGQVSRCDVESSFKNGDVQVQNPTTVHRSSQGPSDMSSILLPSKMASGDNRQPRPGLTAWRLARRKLHILQECDHGFFHEGDCYLLLMIEPGKRSRRTLHCWTGQLASQRDSNRIRKKAAGVEEAVGKMDLFTAETQGHETPCFLRLFPDGICYVEDKGCPLISTAATYCKRLYHITGRKYPRAQCLKPNTQRTLDSGSIYLLDGSPRMYLWIGSKADYAAKVKALSLSRRIRDVQRKGRARLIIVAENDAKSHTLLLRKITGVNGMSHVASPEVYDRKDVKHFTSQTSEVSPVYSQILYWLSLGYDLSGMSEVAWKPLRGELLTSESTYLLDTGPDSPIMIWVGHQTIKEDPQKLLGVAKEFITKRGYSQSVPIVIISQGKEPSFFKRAFLTWMESGIRGIRTYTAGSIGKLLFSGREIRSVVRKTRPAWGPDDGMQGDEGVPEIWCLEDNGVTVVPRDKHGVFFNGNCYVMVHRQVGEYRSPIIYYWLGKQSSPEERQRAWRVATDMDEDQGNSTVLIRVLDGREPSHFMGLIHRKILVYNGRQADAGKEESMAQMFSVEEMHDSNTRVCQVPVAASSLCSRKAFVVVKKTTCHIWYGKNSGGHERGFSKTLPGLLWPNKMYNVQVEVEGKESVVFWQTMGGWNRYRETDMIRDLIRRESVLFHYCPLRGDFQQIPDFTQEDLAHDAVFILDSFDQVMVWTGEEVCEDTKQNMAEIGTAYMKMDPAGRHVDEVQLWFVRQHHEPEAFTRHFQSWDSRLQMGGETVEMLQALIRQENGLQDFQKEAAPAVLSQLRRQSYKILMELRCDQHGLDKAHKERHLSAEEFQKRLNVSREEFYKFPEWKQNQIRRAARLSVA